MHGSPLAGSTRLLSSLLTVLCAAAAGPALAEDRFDLGVRFNVVGGSGKPSNDILGSGVFGRYRLNERWWLGASLDQSPEFDFERPAEVLGLRQDPGVDVIDAVGDSTAFTAWLERVYDRPGRLEWFWTVGLGVNSVDLAPAVGPLEGGGTFDIATDAGSETLLLVSFGLRVFAGKSWAFEVAARGDQHFADWTVLDRASGTSTTIEDYLVRGIHLGIVYRF